MKKTLLCLSVLLMSCALAISGKSNSLSTLQTSGRSTFMAALAATKALQADASNLLNMSEVNAGSWDGNANWGEVNIGGSATFDENTGTATFVRPEHPDNDAGEWRSQRYLTFTTTEAIESNVFTFTVDVTSNANVTLRHVKAEKPGGNNEPYIFDKTEVELRAGVKTTLTISGVPNNSLGQSVKFNFDIGGTHAVNLTLENFVLTKGNDIPDNPFYPMQNSRDVFGVVTPYFQSHGAYTDWSSDSWTNPVRLSTKQTLGNNGKKHTVELVENYFRYGIRLNSDGSSLNLNENSYDYLHIDLWNPQHDYANLVVQIGTQNMGNGVLDNVTGLYTTRSGDWVSFDIPVNAFNLSYDQRANANQIIIGREDDNNLGLAKGSTFAMDNVYFYKLGVEYNKLETSPDLEKVIYTYNQETGDTHTNFLGNNATYEDFTTLDGKTIKKMTRTTGNDYGGEFAINVNNNDVLKNIEGYDAITMSVYPGDGIIKFSVKLYYDKGDIHKQFNVTPGQWNTITLDLNSDIRIYNGLRFAAEFNDSHGCSEPFAEGQYFYLDNIFFTDYDTTVDTDGKGLNWDSATGTTCYVDKIEWMKIDGKSAVTNSNAWAKIHDGDNLTYYTISPEELGGTQHAQLLLKLKKKIKVSDVEIVWANGYAKTYKVYGFENNPVSEGVIPENLLVKENELFSREDKILAYEPYFEVESELQNKLAHESEYILIDLIARGNTQTFGYYFDEIHVGAYDDEYNTPHHLDMADVVTVTDKDENLDITVRNKRGSILSAYSGQVNEQSIKTTWNSSVLKKRDNSETTIYATAQGIYNVTVSGSLLDGTVLADGSGVVTAYKNWRDEENAWESLVQIKYIEKGNAAGSFIRASQNQAQYTAVKAADGWEADDDSESRWSSFSNTDDSGEIPWDGSGNTRRRINNVNQYWMIDLEKNYELTNIELIWERAYAPEYTAFGFETLPDDLDNTSYEEFKTRHADNILYNGVNDETTIKGYPLHDEHSNNSHNGPIQEDNRTRYLVFKLKEPANQDGQYFGFSLWEVYAWGADLTVTDAVTNLDAPDTSVKAGYETSITVKAYGEKDGEHIEEDEWFPVEFSTNESGYFIKEIDVVDTESGKTLKHYKMYRGTDEENDATDDNLVVTIIDNDNGSYGLKAGYLGHKQTKDNYDDGITDGSVNDVSFTIQMTSTNTKGQYINGTFELVVYKNPMKAVTDTSSDVDKKKFGVSDDRRRVYDDGYFDANVLKEPGNVSTTLTQIDLRYVDFTTDNDGNSLATVELPTPSSIKTDGVQMNPNAIYYVAGEGNGNPADNIHGQNVAFTRGQVYYIHDLRVYDGYDYQPLADKGTVALHARYSTNVPKNKRSIIVMPFVPRMNEVNREGKVVKFETMSDFNAEEMSIKATPLTSISSENFPGKPLLISTESDQLYSKTGGYALTFHNNGYVSNSSYAADYTSGDGVSTNAEVAVKVPTDVVDLGNGAVLKGTYTKLMLDNGNSNFWLFSAADENFKPANDASFNYDTENGGTGISVTNQGQDLRNTVLPFFYYLEFGGNASSKQVVTFVTSDETTGISDNPLLNSEERNCGVYDLQGRKVADNLSSRIPNPSSQKGIYIVNGKKIVIK